MCAPSRMPHVGDGQAFSESPPPLGPICHHASLSGRRQCRLDCRVGLSRACAVTLAGKNPPGSPIRS
eukprot:1447061-Prymnesium_polylepis.1